MINAWNGEALCGNIMGKEHSKIWTVIIGGENKNLKYMSREFICWLTQVVDWLCRYIGNK
jgi:hypothetical protein